MSSIKSIEIRELKLEHVSSLVKSLSAEDPEYLKHFTAFELTLESFTAILAKAVNDKYFGIFFSDKIVGFYMLRGFDEGYDIPSYGVLIFSKFSNNGLSKLTLYHAFSMCKLNNISTLMLKVRPDNKFAKKLYESLGFDKTGFDEKNGNYIYHKSLSS
jgi:RimJ/RimL family protein N-acetyltransferase